MSLNEYGSYTPDCMDVEMQLDPALLSDNSPQWDFSESERELVISCEVPNGVFEDIDVFVSAENLVICGKNTEVSHSIENGVMESGTDDGASFQKSLRLPVGFNTDRSEAILKNGTLRVSIPKIENGDMRMRKLEVKAEDHFTSGP